MSQLCYSEALNHALNYMEKNNIKITKKIKKALDKLYPSGHELVHIDEVEEAIEKSVKEN